MTNLVNHTTLQIMTKKLTYKNSDSKTESETSNLDSKANEPSTSINISSDVFALIIRK